jgi:lipoprotein-anchoring transpeptidase ErfK/SrfK
MTIIFPSGAKRVAEALQRGASPADFVLLVDAGRQEMSVWHHGRELRRFQVSTSRHGLGGEPDSNTTPTGWHRVEARYGLDEPLGRVFRSRLPQPEVIVSGGWRSGEEDFILSRILHLTGLEPGVNEQSFNRYIYIHGTNREDLLGTPASIGCIRMSNREVAELFNLTIRHEVYCWIG